MSPNRGEAARAAIVARDPWGGASELAYYRVADNRLGFRLPAYLRTSDFAKRLGTGPQLGGGVVAILTDAAIPCPMVYLVCPPDVAAALWDFSFLRGARLVVFYRPEHKPYARQLAGELVQAGCARPTLAAARGEGV